MLCDLDVSKKDHKRFNNAPEQVCNDCLLIFLSLIHIRYKVFSTKIMFEGVRFAPCTIYKSGKCLTLYHTIPTFNNLEKEAFSKTLWEKEKMLETSSHNVSTLRKTNLIFLFWSNTLSSANSFNLDKAKSL